MKSNRTYIEEDILVVWNENIHYATIRLRNFDCFIEASMKP